MRLIEEERVNGVRRQPAPSFGSVRCVCAECGSHVIVQGGYNLAGQCGNCSSYELNALEAAPAGAITRATRRRATC